MTGNNGAAQRDEAAPEEAEASGTAAPEESAAEAAGEAPDVTDEVMAEVDPLLVLEAENADLKDRLLRAVAEMENLRRRAEREKAEATLYAATSFARDMLNVADSLGRALSSLPEEDRAGLDEPMRNVLSGVEVTRRELLNVFERHNIKLVDPVGEKFDPHFHQAMFEVADPGAAPGTVVQVVQTGYRIGDRVLRPAMVGVAKAAPAASETEEPPGQG